jgi:L-threonylcarbamoyladenylate synthase
MPTETVYGLAADATNPFAVQAIFSLKGRPGTNPLIAHVASAEVARRYVSAWPEAAERLARRFWPGPLTLVLPKTDAIVPGVTAGLPTVAIRVPAHEIALDLLMAFDGPLAAPSANRSTHVSPTMAQHVRDEFGDAIELVLDGGACAVGIESTVLDLASPMPRILRPGGVTREMIEREIGPVEAGRVVTDTHTAATSPGQHAKHYSPRTPTFWFTPSQRASLDLSDAAIVELTLHAGTYAKNLYRRLRLLDTQQLRAIYVELPPDRPEWAAVRDRVLRAARPIDEQADRG